MATLAFNHEEIAARELKPALLELDGISRRDDRGPLQALRGLRQQAERDPRRSSADVDLAAANQVYSELRALKVELSFAIGGIKNHEIYFEHLGGDGGDPDGAIGELIERDFGSVADWRADLKATGMAGRGWAWTAYDWDEGRLFNYVGDAQNTFPIWNATPLVALDVYEHAYFLDYQTDRASYIDAFFDNLDWDVVNDWVAGYQIRPVAPGTARPRRRLPRRQHARSATGSCGSSSGEDIRTVGSGNIGATNVWRTYGARLGRRSCCSTWLKGFVPALLATLVVGHLAGVLAGGGRDARPLAAAVPRLRSAAGRWSRPAAARSSASRRSSAGSAPPSGSSSSSICRYASVASIAAALSLPRRRGAARRAVAGDRLRRARRACGARPAPREHRAACARAPRAAFGSGEARYAG